LLLALLLRLSLLDRAGWLLDGDDALSTLMAFEILDGDRPLMLRNQTYAGAWEPYAMAGSYLGPQFSDLDIERTIRGFGACTRTSSRTSAT